KRDRGLPHPKGGFADKPDAKWSATAIFRILNDETYMGTLIQGRRGTLNYKIKDVIDKPEPEWKRTENAHEAIISPQDFDLARRIMQLDTRTAPGGDKVYLFSGVLICGCCGGRMTRKTNRYKGQVYNYYYCPTGKKQGCSGAGMLREQDLIQCVLESIKGHIAGIVSLESVLTVSDGRKAAQALARQLGHQIEDNERQLTKISNFKSSLYENMVSGLLSKDDYKTLKAKYAADETRLRDAIAGLETERNNALDGKAERLRWMEHFRKFEGLEELDRRTMVNLVRSIRVLGKTELDITFNYQAEYEQALSLLGREAVA
ncbi:MAG: recombinase TnpX, partial [Ruminococcaceae bacterium]|nr:recombinase TnpX [Oscillospiraceae bacterium]